MKRVIHRNTRPETKHITLVRSCELRGKLCQAFDKVCKAFALKLHDRKFDIKYADGSYEDGKLRPDVLMLVLFHRALYETGHSNLFYRSATNMSEYDPSQMLYRLYTRVLGRGKGQFTRRSAELVAGLIIEFTLIAGILDEGKAQYNDRIFKTLSASLRKVMEEIGTDENGAYKRIYPKGGATRFFADMAAKMFKEAEAERAAVKEETFEVEHVVYDDTHTGLPPTNHEYVKPVEKAAPKKLPSDALREMLDANYLFFDLEDVQYMLEVANKCLASINKARAHKS